jgi:hypothetical protein
MKKKFKLEVVYFFWRFGHLIQQKKITRSQKTIPEFKKKIPLFSVIAHIFSHSYLSNYCRYTGLQVQFYTLYLFSFDENWTYQQETNGEFI